MRLARIIVPARPFPQAILQGHPNTPVDTEQLEPTREHNERGDAGADTSEGTDMDLHPIEYYLGYDETSGAGPLTTTSDEDFEDEAETTADQTDERPRKRACTEANRSEDEVEQIRERCRALHLATQQALTEIVQCESLDVEEMREALEGLIFDMQEDY